MISDEHINQWIHELDSGVSREGATILIYQEDPEMGRCEIAGNRAGYLRLGRECLRAAVTPLEPGASFTDVHTDYLFSSRGLHVARISRLDEPTAIVPERKELGVGSKAVAMGCLLLFLAFAVCSLIGLVDVMGRIFGH